MPHCTSIVAYGNSNLARVAAAGSQKRFQGNGTEKEYVDTNSTTPTTEVCKVQGGRQRLTVSILIEMEIHFSGRWEVRVRQVGWQWSHFRS
jgi:hypothetical protein